MSDPAKGAESETVRPRAMILSVGGTPGPILASLNRQIPELVCFFVSLESRKSLDTDILPPLAFRPRHYDWIETPSAEDLLECYRVLTRELPRPAEKWKVPLGEFAVDYTGGTKTMSVALTLATVQSVSRYTYVGGTERTKDGLGVVVDGKERMLHQTNPWDALAVWHGSVRACSLAVRGTRRRPKSLGVWPPGFRLRDGSSMRAWRPWPGGTPSGTDSRTVAQGIFSSKACEPCNEGRS